MSGTLEQQAAAAEAAAEPGGKRGAAAKAAAAKAASPTRDPAAGLALDSLGALGGLLPLNTAFQLLVAPSLAHGVGLRLKRAPPLTLRDCVPAPSYPMLATFIWDRHPLRAFVMYLRSVFTPHIASCSTGGILADPYETVVPAEAFPLPSAEALAPMTIHDVQCGRYRAEMFWDWMRRKFPDGLSIPI